MRRALVIAAGSLLSALWPVMGEAAFAGFKKLIAALKNRDYNTAGDEMKSSQWYVQVKNRGIEDVALMRAAATQ